MLRLDRFHMDQGEALIVRLDLPNDVADGGANERLERESCATTEQQNGKESDQSPGDSIQGGHVGVLQAGQKLGKATRRPVFVRRLRPRKMGRLFPIGHSSPKPEWSGGSDFDLSGAGLSRCSASRSEFEDPQVARRHRFYGDD